MRILIGKIIAVRGIASLTRLAIITALPLFTQQPEFELLIWLISTISIFPFFCSLEFYTYSNRKYLETNTAKDFNYLLTSAILIPLLGIAIITPFALLFFHLSDIDLTASNKTLLLIIIYIESLLNEFMRIHVVIDKQISASLLYLLRQFTLIISTAAFLYAAPNTALTAKTLIFSLTFTLINLIIIAYYSKLWIIRSFTLDKSFFNYLKEGRSIVSKYLASGLLSKINTNGDRIFISSFFDASTFSSYSYILSILNGLSSYVDPLINQMLLPKIMPINSIAKRLNLCTKNLKWVAIYSIATLPTLPLLHAYGPDILSNLSPITLGVASCLLILIQANTYIRFIAYVTKTDTLLLISSAASTTTLFLLLTYFKIYSKNPSIINVIFSVTLAQLTTSSILLAGLLYAKKCRI